MLADPRAGGAAEPTGFLAAASGASEGHLARAEAKQLKAPAGAEKLERGLICVVLAIGTATLRSCSSCWPRASFRSAVSIMAIGRARY